MWNQKQSHCCVFPRLSLVTFPAIANGCTFPSAWKRLNVFLSLSTVTCFPHFDSSLVFQHTSTISWAWACFDLHICVVCCINWNPYILAVSSRKAETTRLAGSFHSYIIYFLSRRERQRHWIWFHKMAEKTHSGLVGIDSITSSKERIKLGCLAAFRVYALRVSGDFHGLVKRNAQTLCSHWWCSRFQILVPGKKKSKCLRACPQWQDWEQN